MANGFVDVPGLSGTVQEKIFETAERLMRETNVAKPLVAFKSDLSDMRPRQYNMRPKLAGAQTLGEHDDLASPQNFDNIAGNIVTPIRLGEQVFLTDPREAQDPSVQDDIAFELVQSMVLADELAILNEVATFSDKIGDGTAPLTLGNLRDAVSHLNSRGGRLMRKIAILDEWQYSPIAKALDANSTPTNVSERLKESIQGAWYVRSMGDCDIYVTSNTVKAGGGTQAKGGVYLKDAILYDERKAFRIAPERDESREGVELNAFLWRGIGKWAPNRGITLHSQISVPALS